MNYYELYLIGIIVVSDEHFLFSMVVIYYRKLFNVKRKRIYPIFETKEHLVYLSHDLELLEVQERLEN